jgi:predicted 3-demethylubiquinone-9 3-methyltransferase (glyoxalase superfamily)
MASSTRVLINLRPNQPIMELDVNRNFQKITPCLWFDDQAEEAAGFYTSLFGQSRIDAVSRYTAEGFEIHGRPEGTVMTVAFELAGYRFVALNGGPHFSFSPAISFYVVHETEAEVDKLWEGLSDGGAVLMELGKYPWSEKYGWLSDKYGLSWQISLGKIADVGQVITPSLLFVGDQCGRAEEAIDLYTSVFDNSSITGILRFGADEAPNEEGTVKHAQFTLGGEVIMAMDSAFDHGFSFNEAVSLMIECGSQEEVDHFWKTLAEGGGEEGVCGWLKDRFGVSWQVVPASLNPMLRDSDGERAARVTEAMLKMTKLDIGALERAYAGG